MSNTKVPLSNFFFLFKVLALGKRDRETLTLFKKVCGKGVQGQDYSQLPNKSGGRNKRGGWENGKIEELKYFK